MQKKLEKREDKALVKMMIEKLGEPNLSKKEMEEFRNSLGKK